MAAVNFEDLLITGAHFGHVTRKWHPRFKPFILMEKNGIHIINLEETVQQFEKAADFLRKIVNKNGEVLFVGTKKQAREIVQQEADRSGMFYVVERWLGGTLTNFMTIKKSIKRLHVLEKEGSSIYENLTKKEVQMLNRERIKLADQHRGIKDMKRLPDALIVVDTDFESTAVAEARRLEIPVIGLVDTNTNPYLVDFPIPANDDSIRTIQLIISGIAEVIIEARKAKIAAEKAAREAAAAEKAAEEAAAAELAAKLAAEEKAEVEAKAEKKAKAEAKAEKKAKAEAEKKVEKKTDAKPDKKEKAGEKQAEVAVEAKAEKKAKAEAEKKVEKKTDKKAKAETGDKPAKKKPAAKAKAKKDQAGEKPKKVKKTTAKAKPAATKKSASKTGTAKKTEDKPAE